MKKIFILFVALVSFSVASLSAKEISISILVAVQQRSAYEKIFKEFTRETGINIVTIPKLDADYKHNLPIWLLEGKNTPDVLYWQASQRLFYYVEKGAIRSITHIWKEGNLDENFSHVKNGVTYNGEVYAIPFSYYHWGIYYKKSLIQKYGGVPDDWETFISQCEKIKQDGITSIGIGTKNKWPAAGWFDYINLRINGLEYHQQLLDGKISFHDQRIQNVFMEWKRLVDNKYFNKNNSKHTWDSVLPLFYRNSIAFLLIGNFISSRLPKQSIVYKDIGFMPFPKIKNIPRYEEAPMDVFMIAKNTKKIKKSELFLKFIARSDIQSKLNENLGYLPPNKDGIVGKDKFIRAGFQLLNQADGVSHYFDRDTIHEFDKKAVPILAEFINTGDIKRLTDQLEKIRKETFMK